MFDDSRGVIATGAAELDTALSGRTRTWSVFATDTVKLTEAVAVTAAFRYNQTRVSTRDQLTSSAPNLDGDFTYRKLNPALGVTVKLAPAVDAYVNASQGSRAPSPIELGCADRDNPCSLPNAMQADPFLEQVVTRTLEAGVRGKTSGWQWRAAVFTAENRDDILFVGTSTSAGYFTNFGRTARQGAELGISGGVGPFTVRGSYSYVRATFRSPACILAENNSTRGQAAECIGAGQDDEILVRPGDRIPGIPKHGFKLGVEWRVAERITLLADMVAFSRQYVRGNENNAHRPGTHRDVFGGDRTYLGPGSVAGYALLDLGARVRLARGWEAFAQVKNVFDRRYASGGALAENPFNAAGIFQTNSEDWSRETFVAPGAPRSFIVGLRYALD